MKNRRQFLAGVGCAAAFAWPVAKAEGARRRFARRVYCTLSSGQYVQPDYKSWMAATQEGLTEAEVLGILGAPIEREDPNVPPGEIPRDLWDSLPEAAKAEYMNRRAEELAYGWHYGRLDFQSPSVPELYRFDIYFKKGRVALWSEPFDRPFSADGIPTAPKIIMPMKNMVMGGDVQTIDFRWGLPSGVYPMQFVLEYVGGYDTNVEAEGGTWKPTREWFEPAQMSVEVPHLALANPGHEHWRWRVKARNSLGDGPWSDWGEFRLGR